MTELVAVGSCDEGLFGRELDGSTMNDALE